MRRAAAAFFAAGWLAAAAAPGAAEATLCLADQVCRGALQAGAGVRWKLGDREISPSDVLALAVDSASPRLAECGVRFADGSFLVGRFPDFTAGQENVFESESFGSFKVAAERPAALYVGGPPGQYPEQEAAKTAGVVMRSGEFVAGEVLYVSARFAGLRIAERIRKFNLAPVYAVLLRSSAASASGPWQARTLNGDLLFGDVMERGFRLDVLGAPRTVELERLSSARQLRYSLLASATVGKMGTETLLGGHHVVGPPSSRRFRNGEGQPLQLMTRRVVPDGLWQHGPSTLSLSPPAASKALVFRAWREPGFCKGQIVVRFRAGQEILKELTLEPQAWVIEGALPLPVGTSEVNVTLLAGRDEGYGDRIIWEELSAAR
jgi:hypothetical protein